MPRVYIHLKESQSKLPIVSGAFVSVQQDKFFEGFKELFKQTPDVTGTVDFEATSFTKYRIVADGSSYNHNELLIDTGGNLFTPIHEDLYLERRIVPLPDAPDIASLFRDVGLSQTLPVTIGLVAVAVIVIAIAYLASKGLTVAAAAKKSKDMAASVKEKSKEAAANVK